MRFICLAPLFIVFCCTVFIAQAQVGKAKENAREYKSGSSGSRSSGSSEGGSSSDAGSEIIAIIGWEIVQLPFKAMYLGQADQLLKARTEDWRISFEGRMLGGYDVFRDVTLIQPNVRGNWGLFSTQLRYNRIFDDTGVLSTWDWQVVQFNLVNNQDVRIIFGMGLSHEIEIDQTHFEGSTSFTLFLNDRVWAPTLEYRWSGDGIPRREFSAILDYRPRNENNIFNNFFVGYVHQNWYRVPFDMISAGVGFKIQ